VHADTVITRPTSVASAVQACRFLAQHVKVGRRTREEKISLGMGGPRRTNRALPHGQSSPGRANDFAVPFVGARQPARRRVPPVSTLPGYSPGARPKEPFSSSPSGGRAQFDHEQARLTTPAWQPDSEGIPEQPNGEVSRGTPTEIPLPKPAAPVVMPHAPAVPSLSIDSKMRLRADHKPQSSEPNLYRIGGGHPEYVSWPDRVRRSLLWSFMTRLLFFLLFSVVMTLLAYEISVVFRLPWLDPRPLLAKIKILRPMSMRRL
jgi:hypothetical protein